MKMPFKKYSSLFPTQLSTTSFFKLFCTQGNRQQLDVAKLRADALSCKNKTPWPTIWCLPKYFRAILSTILNSCLPLLQIINEDDITTIPNKNCFNRLIIKPFLVLESQSASNRHEQCDELEMSRISLYILVQFVVVLRD